MNNLTAIIILCFTFGLSLNTQMAKMKTIPRYFESLIDFPESWLGNWVGDLHIYKENKLVQTLPMELEMQAIDTSENYVWAIIYGEDKVAGRRRSYELEIVDAEKGHLSASMKKTPSKLESYLFGNKLYSQFSVMESQILCIYEKQGMIK